MLAPAADVRLLPSASVHAAVTVSVTSPVVAVSRLPSRFKAALDRSARLPDVASHLSVSVTAMLPVDVSVAAVARWQVDQPGP